MAGMVVCLHTSRRKLGGRSSFSDPFNGRDSTIPQHSLLNQTLGLSRESHSRFRGPSSSFPTALLDAVPSRSTYLGEDVRRISPTGVFTISPDCAYQAEQDTLSTIESCVGGHGLALLNLYFRIVHPPFPILHKKVFYEKYLRSQQREFSPPCLAAVYFQALHWWEYGGFNSATKPDAGRLRGLAETSFKSVLRRPKLSTVQAGLLLAQRHDGVDWLLLSQVTAVAYELGLHLDCTSWSIPAWEKGLRKRLAWAVFVQDSWNALLLGRPCLIQSNSWQVPQVTAMDFPERAEDEDDQEGSAEVEKGRELFMQFIMLSELVAALHTDFNSLSAQAELASPSGGGIAVQRAAALQQRLEEWSGQLPEGLSIGSIQSRKLNSVGYLHVAYWAACAALRRITLRLAAEAAKAVSFINDQRPVGSCLIECYSTALSTYEMGVALVGQLRPEHLQSFWYFTSSHSLTLLGCLGADLYAYAQSFEERRSTKKRLEDYRWTLKVSAKAADFMLPAIDTLNEILAIMDEGEHSNTLLSNPSLVSPTEHTQPHQTEIDFDKALFLDSDGSNLIFSHDFDHEAFNHLMTTSAIISNV